MSRTSTTASRYERLLAKSSPDRADATHPATLRQHTAMVLSAADALLEARGDAALRALGLPASWRPRLDRIVKLGAFVHDLGKCSDHFQRMLRHPAEPQLVRHEALSAWLARPEGLLGGWLLGAVDNEAELDLAAIAAAGHHRKFPPRSRDADPLTLLLSHEDFAATCGLGRTKLGLGPAPSLQDVTLTRVAEITLAVTDWEERLNLSQNWRRLLASAKALVIAADVAGSALPKAPTPEERKPSRWIRAQLGRRNVEAAHEVLTTRLRGNALRGFQERVRDCGAPVVLVEAGCGGGKTIAAYAWAAAQHPERRLWVTYPTTGTTTEGFRDYLANADVRGRLEHGRRKVDLDIFNILEIDERVDDDPKERAQRVGRQLDRLDALRSWGVDAVTCTVDTVLGLLVNQRKGMYAWPSLCDSAIVFDEVHSYDDLMFGLLLRFIEALPGIPVLLMTASLPEHRRVALRDTVARVHGRDLPIITGDPRLEELPRYVLERREQVPDVEVAAALERGEKVLWVCNTVSRALATAQRLQNLDPVVYHSRFRYVDRVTRHGEVVDRFATEGRAFAVTTQVAEMSLDLSAHLLVTDLAPIPALIQRLGRLNRRSDPDRPDPVRPCLVLPFSGLPYDHGLVRAEVWLARLGELEGVSQRDLIEAWSADEPDVEPPVAADAAWLDGGLQIEPDACREASPGLSVLLPEDASDVAAGRRDVTEVVLPMSMPPGPLARQWRSWKREHGIPIVPPGTVDYDEHRGGRWITDRKGA